MSFSGIALDDFYVFFLIWLLLETTYFTIFTTSRSLCSDILTAAKSSFFPYQATKQLRKLVQTQQLICCLLWFLILLYKPATTLNKVIIV